MTDEQDGNGLTLGTTYEVTLPEYIGEMQVRAELFPEPYQPPRMTNSESELSDKIQALVEELRVLRRDPKATARLHDIELMIVDDVLKEFRFLRCSGCLHWMTALVKKARGEAWKT